MSPLLRKAYQSVYRRLPQQLMKVASRAAARLGGDPPVFYDPLVHPARISLKGSVVFSVDFEMAWAWQYARRAGQRAMTAGLRERAQVPLILAKMEELQIPATWAIVGHLFLRECARGEGGAAHPDLPRPVHFTSEFWEFTAGDWYQHDPCSDVSSHPTWYAPDLVEKILAATASHEIACHGFSHLGFGDYCPVEVAGGEIDAALEVMHTFGVSPRTFVFPGNEEGHFDLIRARGFEIVRAFPHPYAALSLPIRRPDGLWGIHQSRAVDLEGEGWDYEERLRHLRKYVDAAVRLGLAAHFWFHPSLPNEQMNLLLFPLMRYCCELREKGALDILTMEALVSTTKDRLSAEGRI